MKIIKQTFLALAISVSAISAQAELPQYTATSLGGFQGYSINNYGQIAGNTGAIAQIYSNGVLQNIDPPAGALRSNPYSISDTGYVTGGSNYGIGVDHAFIYHNGISQDLRAVVEGSNSSGYSSGFGVNSSGQVVGVYFSGPNQKGRAFLYSNGSKQDLGTLSNTVGIGTTAFAINNHGQIVGDSPLGNGVSHAFIFSDGVMHDIGSLNGESGASYARAINDAGQIVGYSNTSNGASHAFLFNNGVMQDIGTLGGAWKSSWASSINNNGDVVGYSDSIDGQHSAFFYSQVDGLQNLNSLVTGLTGARLTSAYGINDQRQILARGSDGFTYLLNPVPLPAAGWLFFSAIGGLSYLRRRTV